MYPDIVLCNLCSSALHTSSKSSDEELPGFIAQTRLGDYTLLSEKDIPSLVTSCQADIEKCKEELSRLRSYIEQVERRQETLKHDMVHYMHIHTHITRFPPEIISEIFYHCVPSHLIDVPRVIPVRSIAESLRSKGGAMTIAPINISAVCKRWREIASDTPSLWSYIPLGNIKYPSFPSGRPDRKSIRHCIAVFKRFIRQSRNLPLTISLDCQTYSYENADIISVVASVAHRIVALELIRMSSKHFTRHDLIFPFVEELVLGVNSLCSLVDQKRFPSLRTFTNRSFRLHSADRNQDDASRAELNVLQATLDSIPSITSLSLDELNCPMIKDIVLPLTSSQITTLRFIGSGDRHVAREVKPGMESYSSWTTFRYYLSWLVFPNLRTLYIDELIDYLQWESPETDHAPIFEISAYAHKFFSASPLLVNLHVSRATLNGSDLRYILSAASSVQNLTIGEFALRRVESKYDSYLDDVFHDLGHNLELLPRLRSLTIPYFNRPGTHILEMIKAREGSGFVKLTLTRFTYIPRFDDELILQIRNCSPNLKVFFHKIPVPPEFIH